MAVDAKLYVSSAVYDNAAGYLAARSYIDSETAV